MVKLPLFLRVNRLEILESGMAIVMKPLRTTYVAPSIHRLNRQKLAMDIVRHLGIAPSIKKEYQLRGFSILETTHPFLRPVQTVLRSGTRNVKIHLIRRLGATLGMAHSIRDERIGFLAGTSYPSIAAILQRMAKLSLAVTGKTNAEKRIDAIDGLWTEKGGTLVVNFRRWPVVKSSEDGLLLMDFSRAMIFEPLWDLIRIDPSHVNLDEHFFWEYFIQGYCATGELSVNWQQKLSILATLLALNSKSVTPAHLHSKWWIHLT